MPLVTAKTPPVHPRGRRRSPDGQSRRFENIPEDPHERFHLFWNPTRARFRASHMGLDYPEERFITGTNPIETVEWLLPGWRVLTRLRTAQDLGWRDTPRPWGSPTPLRTQQGIREHLLMAHDNPRDTTCTTDTADSADTADTADSADTADTADSADTADTADSADEGMPGNWMLLSLPTTNAHPFFRAWGTSAPISRWHWRNWEPHERAWAVQWALRTALVAPTPIALADSLCLQHEDPPAPGDRDWWTAPDHARTLAMGLAGQTGSGTHPSGASRKAALTRHAATLDATRTLLALGAVPHWDALLTD